MIAYDLQCSQGHTFEGWFENQKAYKSQQRDGLLTCPVCNDMTVSKIPSTFSVKTPHPATDGALEKITQKVVDYVKSNFDNVGCDFAKEALKIHYGATEPRNIRGVSTKEEEKTLKDEGVDFFKIPLPETSDTED